MRLEVQKPSEVLGDPVSPPGIPAWVVWLGSYAPGPGFFPPHLPLGVPALPTMPPLCVPCPPYERDCVPFGPPGSASVTGFSLRHHGGIILASPVGTLRPGPVLRMHLGPEAGVCLVTLSHWVQLPGFIGRRPRKFPLRLGMRSRASFTFPNLAKAS